MRTTWLSAAVLGITLAACGDDSSGTGGSGTGGGASSSATTSGPATSTSTGPGSTASSGAGGDDATSSSGAGGDPGEGGAGGGTGGTGGGEESGIETSHDGIELDEWMKAYWAWYYGGVGDGFIGDRQFLDLPDGTDEDQDGVYEGEIDIDLAATDGFVWPMQAWIGETYVGGDPPDDDPDGFPEEEVFTGMDLVVTLDGETIIDSEVDDLSVYYWDAIDFDETIIYDEPTDYGAIGAIWCKGIGILHQPLEPGEHVLTLTSYVPGFEVGYDFAWNITVE